MKVRIGTRGSKLALVQTEYVKQRLEKAYPEDEYEIVIIKTKGDKIQDKPLNQIGAKGLFVKEIEEQILSGEISMGVHSMKDMPAKPAPALGFSKMWKREAPFDVLVLREAESLDELKSGAVIGTGSERRRKQLHRLRPDLVFTDIRGNIDTRLKKMEEQKLDGIVLAAAGLNRLGIKPEHCYCFNEDEMIPAPAQGILALELREDNEELHRRLDALYDEDTELAGRAERTFLEEIGGDCHVPVGAYCEVFDAGKKLVLHAVYGKDGGEEIYPVCVEGREPETLAKQAAAEIRRQMAGKVLLTGAGPGDVRLITVRGLDAVKQADCIIYDRLAAPELLMYAKENCEKIYVGKENHNHTMPQEKINELLVEKAMQYPLVVRLKGGDPYVFGRGGEEALGLEEKGVPFEVIPGISSAIAGPACAGIPVTHRGIADGFHVVTAHNKKDELADIDFAAMAGQDDTCIFLMGLGKLNEIAERLIEAGKPEETPVSVISHATCRNQETVVSDLGHITEEVKQKGLTPPALIVVGDTVKLHEKLKFSRQNPLYGKNFLLPKIGKEPSLLAEMLRTEGACVKEVQIGEIRMLDVEEEIFAENFVENRPDWIIFTGKNGVKGFFRQLYHAHMDARNLCGCRIAVMGKKTEETLKSYGIHADWMPQRADSIAFCEEFGEVLQQSEEKQSILCVMPKEGNREIPEKLEKLCKIHKIRVYENREIEMEKQEFLMKDGDAVIFTCASLAERSCNTAGKEEIGRMQIFSIGRNCTKKLQELGLLEIIQSEKSSYEGVLRTILEYYR